MFVAAIAPSIVMIRLLAAATPASALPLPAGWTTSPALATLKLPTVWTKNVGSAAEEEISVVSVPLLKLPNSTLEASLVQSLHSRTATVSTSQITACGAQADLLTVPALGGKAMEIMLESSAGSSYIVSYTRRASSVADPAAESFIRSACPTSPDGVGALNVPTGWVQRPQGRILAAWMGPNLGDTLSEVLSPSSNSVSDEIKSWLSQSNTANALAANVTISTKGPFTMCGHQATEATAAMSNAGLAIHTDIVATQTSSGVYMLTYTTAQPSFDPRVISAMHAFCPQP